MLPTYRPGDTLLGWRWFSPRVGQVVVARQGDHALIKRVVKLNDQHVWLMGDNRSYSTDSRHFGPLNRADLVARIIVRLG
jgi:phage repressor protein C with HTH and peptisase S24 domain